MIFVELLKSSLPTGLTLEELLNNSPAALWEANPQLAAAISLAKSGRFDVADYLTRYPDVARANLDPIVHFVTRGILENKTFRLFDSQVGMLEAQLEAMRESMESLQVMQHAEKREHSTDCARQSSYSIIVTVWKRKNYLAEQYLAFMRQSLKPCEIIYLINGNRITPEFIRKATDKKTKIIQSGINSLYTRFALAHIAEGEFVGIVDDDIIPGEFWFANAMRACKEYNAFVVANGRIYNNKGIKDFFTMVTPPPGLPNNKRISCADTDVFCDWGCNSYFFKREWTGAIISQRRYKDAHKTYDDIQATTALYLAAGIRCVCPMQPEWDKRLHGSLKEDYGNDANAVWLTGASHFPQRKAFLAEQEKAGYVPVQKRDNLYRFHIIVAFGERAWLERCLLSIKGQIYDNFTCTLIDDCCDGKDSAELMLKLGLDESRFRYIKMGRKGFALRTRELATDMLAASPADVIVHLDGDDWFAHPHVLWQLNRIYRCGATLFTYGNTVSLKSWHARNFSEYDVFKISKKWNMAQTEPDAKEFPFRQLRRDELKNGWASAPWGALHTRSYQHILWILLDKGVFRFKNGSLIRYASDAAIMVPMLSSLPYELIMFTPDVSYVYQDCANTTHARKDFSDAEKNATRKRICEASSTRNLSGAGLALQAPANGIIPDDGEEIYGCLDCVHEKSVWHSQGDSSNAILTSCPQNLFDQAILCLQSYLRNLSVSCQAAVIIPTNDSAAIEEISAITEGSAINAVFPARAGKEFIVASESIARGEELSNPVRAALLCAFIEKSGIEMAIWQDLDLYTVANITDIHRQCSRNSTTLFPVFGDDEASACKSLESGMLAMCANRNSPPFMAAKFRNRSGAGADMLSDSFLQYDGVARNHDHGIAWQVENREAMIGLISPSQRSCLLGCGSFVRIFRMSKALLEQARDQAIYRATAIRPVCAFYLLARLFTQTLLKIKLNDVMPGYQLDALRLRDNFVQTEALFKCFAPGASTLRLRDLWASLNSPHPPATNLALTQWGKNAREGISFDNLEMLAELMLSLFPHSQTAAVEALSMRRYDLRYITENVLANPELDYNSKEANREAESAGEILRKRFERLRNARLNY